MLSIQKVNKHYHSKKGESVHVLKDISIDFPKKGFVCLIGKSGSGKSTLLNVLGGLDRYDSGEILIKGKSSNTFKAKEWDSYRNTYLGFVFQDFNIIDSYSIGANIALALQLQGVKASEAIPRTKEILKNVEAENLYDRKPNELSGGQKQRIAIARALVKNPEIIIADEPTGNLDSETSLVIMKILQKLAQDHLVIMVTHDMEFAHQYGDRLIELKDGNIIKDETVKNKTSKRTTGIQKGGSSDELVLRLQKGTPLNKEAIDALNQLIQSKSSETIYLTASANPSLASSVDPAIINEQASTTGDVGGALEYNYAHDFKLIRSKLPFKNSFKMALSSIGAKKFKLIFASILFIVSIGLFGFSRTVTRFDFPLAASLSYQEAQTERVFISKLDTVIQPWGDEESVAGLFSRAEVQSLESQTGLNMGYIYDLSKPVNVGNANSNTNTLVQAKSIKGILEVDSLAALNLQMVAGRFPQNTSEVVITDYVAAQLTSLSLDAYLAQNPTLKLPFKTVNVVGVLATDYQEYTFLNNLNAAQLLNEQSSVLAFRNNDQILYSRLVVPKGFYQEYEKNIDILPEQFTFNAYIESRELENEWPYEFLGNSFIRTTPEIINSDYVALFPDVINYDPETAVILDVNVYARLLQSLGRINNASSLDYLGDWTQPLSSRISRLSASGYGQIELTTIFSSQVTNAWGDLEDTVVIGLIDFESYRNFELLPEVYVSALRDEGIDLISEADFNRFGVVGHLEYLEALRRVYLPSYQTYEAYSLTPQSNPYEYMDQLGQALQNTNAVFIQDVNIRGYTVYLSDLLDRFNISYPTYASYVASSGNDPFGYSEALAALLESNNRSYLSFQDFNSEYLRFGEMYMGYLNSMAVENEITVESVYVDIFGVSVISEARYDRINPLTSEKVHGLAIQLSDDVERNYDFFTLASALGVKHVTPSGELLQVFEDFTSQADAIFAYVSLGFAGFAGLLLFLNISQSILAKKKEIGTLRAMGARGNDVALIFINEASILGLFSALLAIVGITIATVQLNVFLSGQLGVDLAIFNISPVITLEMMGLTLAIVLLAAFLPVKRVSSMKPIDAIKNK